MACHKQNVVNMIECFRRQLSLLSESERTTICGADNMLLILQLSLAEVNKKNGREFSASLSDVLRMWKYLLKDKIGQICEDAELPDNYIHVRKTYDLFLKSSNMLDLIDLHERMLNYSSEMKILRSDQLLEFLDDHLHSSEEAELNFSTISTPCKNNMDTIKVKKQLRRIFCAYLNLLVNSKNDFALAQILNCPDRGLGREAFTDLKHASRDKQMSLFLMATSFVRTIELGGRGYAPSESDPLRKHLKGLSLFVHFIDRLNEILGGTEDARATAELIVTTIKMHLVKGRGSGDPVSEAAEDVAQDLNLRFHNHINSNEIKSGSTAGISPARPRIHAINRGTALCGRETIKSFLKLLDEEAANIPSKKTELLCADEENSAVFGALSLMTLFRSPEPCSGSSPKPLNQRIQKCPANNKPKLKQNLIRSQFACTYKDNNLSKMKETDFPSMSQFPTCIHPAPKIVPVLCLDEEPLIENKDLPARVLNSVSGNTVKDITAKVKAKTCKNPRGGKTKRKQVDLCDLNNIENEPPQKKVTVEQESPKKGKDKQDFIKSAPSRNGSKTASKNKLIAGQAKLTSFFRM
ncbi:PCNA-interacting partner isoform X2 [Bombina bombina]|nr:PCNA-interacting partner isoform X2 [Bombina bombina]